MFKCWICSLPFQQKRDSTKDFISLNEDTCGVEGNAANARNLKPSISSSTSGGTTTTEMLERRDELPAELAPTSEAINQQKQKHVTGSLGGNKSGSNDPSRMRRRKLGTGTTVQPEIEGGIAVAKAASSTSNGSGPGTAERPGGKGTVIA